jgi:phenylalanyl-tRNA synthetase beta chain
MKLSLSWVRDWIETDADTDAIAEALTRRGFYVEGTEVHGPRFTGVVVARVLEVEKHPNADKLSLCRVDGGSGELRVVCGAPNVRAGMLVPLATVGAKLPGGLVIKKSKIRGEESQGMLCSASELEISDDHDGIVDLERTFPGADLVAGRPAEELFGPPDSVLDVEIPFNRPDGMGVVGLAREVKAAFGGIWTDAARSRFERRWTAPAAAGAFDLELEDAEGCPRYIAQAIEGLTIGPSPAWLAQRLEAIGQRPINNVVDLTNFLLFELGQPLHAFDLDRLNGPAIRVRRARGGEKLTTLDGKERELDPEVLVIADRDHAVAVAGVMGGASSEVHTGTTRLLLECAWFEPRRVRRGARRLGLSTEASKRYERGVDPAIGPVAVARFLELLAAMCPGMRAGASRERNLDLRQPITLALRSSRCTRVIGMPVSAADAARHLESMEFGVTPGDPIAVTVPTWRIDVTLEDDLVEEVARANGYDRIPDAPLETAGAHAVRSPRERMVARARAAMLARGLTEACSTALLSQREAEVTATVLGADPARLVRLLNPMSREHEVLRPNLLGGLLRACAHNLKQGLEAVRLFEIGHGFAWGDDEAARAAPSAQSALPVESLMIAALVTGPRYAHAHDPSQQMVDFADARGIWDAWLQELRVDTPQWRAYSGDGWKRDASAEVASSASRIGWAGTLGQTLLREWEIDAQVHVFVALLEPLIRSTERTPRASLAGRFPPVRRDLAFFVPDHVTHQHLDRVLTVAAGERLASIELFDVYAGPGTPTGMKSMAFALRFQHPERTMTEPEVQAIQERMVTAVAKECDGRLREK